MPTQLAQMDQNDNEIKAKIAYNGEVLIIYIDKNITLEQLCAEMRQICRFGHDQVFTMKWVDEEGDPCTISTQIELREAIRLYEINRDSELTIHVAPRSPPPLVTCLLSQLDLAPKLARRLVLWSVAQGRGNTIDMAWGYWSATTLGDRGRSPRRNQQNGAVSHSHQQISSQSAERPERHAPSHSSNSSNGSSASTSAAILDEIPAQVQQQHQSQQQQQQHAAGPHQQSQHLPYQQQQQTLTHYLYSQQPHHSQMHHPPQYLHQHEIASASEFDLEPNLSRRPSLDLSIGGPQGSLAGIICSAHGSNSRTGTLSAGNTLTRAGSRHTAISNVDYAVPHHLHQHHLHHAACVEYHHQTQLSFSDDDSSSEPGYATVFPNVPSQPGMPCQGEDRSIYRRGARRWRKLYRVNGHIFQAKRFNRKAFCAFCHDRIWGLGRQGFKCIQCKLLVHKKCHKTVQKSCTNELVEPVTREGHHNGENILQQIQHQPIPPDTTNHELGSEYLPDIAGDSVPVEDPASDDLEPGSQRQYSLRDFELIRVIGRGSYAKVLMVELRNTRRIYAMKVIKKALVTDDEDIDWVQTEKHVFETASNHPFLVGLHSCFQTPSRLFFVIEFVRGGDLMFHMQRQRRLPEEHARFYAAEISLALNFLHSKGIIYRDLKLDNVLLDHEGHIKLTDYGMCKEGIRSGDTTSTFCGTPNYIAPEILRGEDYGFSVDWWALGVLLYEMLAGRSPFDIAGASENPDQNTEDYLFQVILDKTIRIPRSLSVKAANVLKGFLNKNPADRLGCHSSDSFAEIQGHQFFKSIDWELLEQKQVPPPYKPRLDSDRDLANFPPEFTDEPVHLTPDDARIIEKIDQSEFEGFEYVNPLLMSQEDCV